MRPSRQMARGKQNWYIRFTKKEVLLSLPGIFLALASLGSSDPLVFVPMLILSGIAFVVLCFSHAGRLLVRCGCAILITAILLLIGWRDLRKAHPAVSFVTITWPNPPSLPYGQTLSATQLNAVASVEGKYTYNPTFGESLNPGTHTLSVFFTPNDPSLYAPQTKSVLLKVTQPLPKDADALISDLGKKRVAMFPKEPPESRACAIDSELKKMGITYKSYVEAITDNGVGVMFKDSHNSRYDHIYGEGSKAGILVDGSDHDTFTNMKGIATKPQLAVCTPEFRLK